MAEEIIYTNYSAEDIESYLHGRLNAKEMHALERAALQDPFLADAIEGYSHADVAQTRRDLNLITAAILGEKQPAKIVAMPVKGNYRWFAAAAVAAVIVTVGIWLARMNNSPELKNNLAGLTTTKKSAAATAPVQPLNKAAADTARLIAGNLNKTGGTAWKGKKTDTLNASARGDVQVNNYASNLSPVSSAKANDNMAARVAHQASTSVDSTVIARQSQPNAPLVTPAAQTVAVANSLTGKIAGLEVNTANNRQNIALKGMAGNTLTKKFSVNAPPSGPAANKNVIQGYLYVNNNSTKYNNKGLEALGNALVYGNGGNGKQMAVSDSNGHFAFNTTDSLLTVEVASAGYETRQAQLKSNTANYIIVNPLYDVAAKTEVIELESHRKKNKKLPADSLFPEGGWQSFREYVYKKLHRLKDMDTTGTEITILGGGSVEIEFTVDENGLARDLKITRSVSKDVDTKALEVVRQWPKWIATRKNSKGKVVIQY